MNIEVRVQSRGGNTQKVADAIAGALSVQAKNCETPLSGPVDILFLGGAVYAGGADKQLKQLIDTLDPAAVKCVAVFATSAIAKAPDKTIEKLVQARGIPLAKESFHCWGAFTAMRKGRPNSEDLQKAAAFAQRVAKE